MQSRTLHTAVTLKGKMQLGNIFNKVLYKDTTKKMRQKAQNNSVPSITATPLGLNINTTHKNRRVAVLNKVFMNHISDLMATGEVAPKLLGRGIEITHVRVSPDYRLVNVYWYAQSDLDELEKTQDILNAAAGHLQHELTQLRVIGIVPPLQFVKNKYVGVVREIEERLSTVDFGENYVPTSYIKKTTRTPILETSLDPELKAKLTEIDKIDDKLNQNEEDNKELFPIIEVPTMSQDVMGFNHEIVLKKIKANMAKHKLAKEEQISRMFEKTTNNVPEEPHQIMTDLLSESSEDKLFDDFLQQRLRNEKRKERAKSLKELKLEEEQRWIEDSKDDNINELQISEEYQDEYEDFESRK